MGHLAGVTTQTELHALLCLTASYASMSDKLDMAEIEKSD